MTDQVNGWSGRWIAAIDGGNGDVTGLSFELTRVSGGTAVQAHVDLGAANLMSGEGYVLPSPFPVGAAVVIPLHAGFRSETGFAAGVRVGESLQHVAVFSCGFNYPPASPGS